MDADIPIYRRAEIFPPLCAKALWRKPGQKSAGSNRRTSAATALWILVNNFSAFLRVFA
jgi:hypothetical protein